MFGKCKVVVEVWGKGGLRILLFVLLGSLYYCSVSLDGVSVLF